MSSNITITETLGATDVVDALEKAIKKNAFLIVEIVGVSMYRRAVTHGADGSVWEIEIEGVKSNG